MSELFPIIRRQRRPLLGADRENAELQTPQSAPLVVGNGEPVAAVATKPVASVPRENQPSTTDAKVIPQRSAR